MTCLYNDVEPYACDWLENLINEGHIASGRVDRRSIADVQPADLASVTQFHTFAGIGVWSRALRLAAWPDDAPVWTGSCPCQPFSAAGKRGGFDDERHLWPEWFRLIRECRPAVLFGEQVASSDGLVWLDSVFADLERIGYACAAADLCACGVGAPHKRNRLFFVAHTDGCARNKGSPLSRWSDRRGDAQQGPGPRSGSSAGVESVAYAIGGPRGLHVPRGASRAEDAEVGGRREARLVGDAGGTGAGWNTTAAAAAQETSTGARREYRRSGDEPEFAGATRGFWRDADWLYCVDDKWRPVEPGTFPLAHRATSRVGRLRAYGNAIVAPLAATFIVSALEAIRGAA